MAMADVIVSAGLIPIWSKAAPVGKPFRIYSLHDHSIKTWQHRHVFLGAAHDTHELRTWLVVALTSTMMVAEIVAGAVFGSMALTADGWHMCTHAAALA